MISPTSHTVPHAPHLNALKHGLRSEATLLPGDNRAAFAARRDELFHLYQPRTVDEAFCVAQMAKLQWRIQRCDRWQEIYDDQQDALLCGDPGLESGLCEPDAHRSLHRPMDCELHAGRMDRRLCRLRAKLFELQRLRRLGLIAGQSQIAADYRVLLAAEQAATDSDDKGIPKPAERDENGASSGQRLERPEGGRHLLHRNDGDGEGNCAQTTPHRNEGRNAGEHGKSMWRQPVDGAGVSP